MRHHDVAVVRRGCVVAMRPHSLPQTTMKTPQMTNILIPPKIATTNSVPEESHIVLVLLLLHIRQCIFCTEVGAKAEAIQLHQRWETRACLTTCFQNDVCVKATIGVRTDRWDVVVCVHNAKDSLSTGRPNASCAEASGNQAWSCVYIHAFVTDT